MHGLWFPPGFDEDLHRVGDGLHVDAILTSLADRQHGVVTARQVLALGLSRAHVSNRIRSGHLHVIGRGAYLVGRATPTGVARRMASVLVAGPDAYLDDLTAAAQLMSDLRKDALYRSVGLSVYRTGWWVVHYERERILADLIRFEETWQATGGLWTPETPEPVFGGTAGLRRAA